MFLLVGLGNPGAKYAYTRHNIGFMVLDRLAERLGVGAWQDKFNAHFAKTQLGQQDVVLVKPQTFMNLSGQAVQQAQAFYKIPLENLMVAHDELDLPLGALRIKIGGGAAGHRGVQSVASHCGEGYIRLRMGIGRPDSENYVLSDFPKQDHPKVLQCLDNGADALNLFVTEGVTKAMNRFNQRVSAEP